MTVKKVPVGARPGFVDMDKEPVSYKSDTFLKRYLGGITLEVGEEAHDSMPFIVEPGTYQVEAKLTLPDGDEMNDETIQMVE